MMTLKTKRRAIYAALMAAGMLWLGAGQAKAANEPEIVGNSAVIYLDGKDEISVVGDQVKSVAYSSGNEAVATVSGTGEVVPHKQGTARIEAKVVYGDGEKSQTKELSYDLRVMDASTNYFVIQKNIIKDLTDKGKQMKEVYIPEYCNNVKITGLWKNLFKNDTTLEKVVLSDNLKTLCDDEVGIGEGQIFIGCSRLKEIHIGRDTDSYVNYLRGNGQLQKITVDPRNKVFRVKDSVLFREDPNDEKKEWLICYPAAKGDASYTVPDGVSAIRQCAFYGVKNIKKVTLPDSMSHIEMEAFMKSGLAEVNLPEGLEWISGRAFQESELKEVVIPGKTWLWGSEFFKKCSKLEKVTLPEKVEKNCQAFRDCNSLKTVVVRNSSKKIYVDNFAGCTSLEGFQMMPGTSEFYVKDGVLFQKDVLVAYPQGKKNLSYELPSGVKRIQYRAFWGVKHLTKVDFNTDLVQIGYEAFLDCQSLTEIFITENVTKINEEWDEKQYGPKDLFKGCVNLKRVSVDDRNKKFASDRGVLYSKSMKTLYCYPANRAGKKYTMHKNVTCILEGAFAGSRNLQNLVIGKKVSKIKDGAFKGAEKLSSVNLPASLKELGHWAFKDCKKLKKIVIPSKVKKIEQYSFSGCNALREVVVGKNVSQIDIRAFQNCKNLRKLTFLGVKWSKGQGIYGKPFVKAGSSSYSKLKVQVPYGKKKRRTACKKALRKGSLNKKAKIVFEK